MRASYLERLDRVRYFCCVAIVLDASAIVKIELPKENFGAARRPREAAHRFCFSCGDRHRSPFLLQLRRPPYSIVATGGRIR